MNGSSEAKMSAGRTKNIGPYLIIERSVRELVS